MQGAICLWDHARKKSQGIYLSISIFTMCILTWDMYIYCVRILLIVSIVMSMLMGNMGIWAILAADCGTNARTVTFTGQYIHLLQE